MTRKQIGLLAAFAAANVEYAVVGGVAVNAYGHLRSTYDLDVFIRPTPENAQAAYDALRGLGVPLEGIGPMDLLDDEANLRFGPVKDQIDILASIGDMPFDQVWRNRLHGSIGALSVPFISKSDLIQNTAGGPFTRSGRRRGVSAPPGCRSVNWLESFFYGYSFSALRNTGVSPLRPQKRGLRSR